MGRDDMTLFYFDAIVDNGLAPEELDKEIKRLKTESDKLTEWPEM